jgi:hypothetical protein
MRRRKRQTCQARQGQSARRGRRCWRVLTPTPSWPSRWDRPARFRLQHRRPACASSMKNIMCHSATAVAASTHVLLMLAPQAVLAAAAIVALLYFGRKTATSLANNLRDGVLNLGKLAAFWAVVVLAAKFVIEN